MPARFPPLTRLAACILHLEVRIAPALEAHAPAAVGKLRIVGDEKVDAVLAGLDWLIGISVRQDSNSVLVPVASSSSPSHRLLFSTNNFPDVHEARLIEFAPGLHVTPSNSRE